MTASKNPRKIKPPPNVDLPKTGRPSNYKREFDEIVERLALLSLTDDEIAHFFKTTRQTLYRWDEQHPSFHDARARGRVEADADVVNALRARAKGYAHPSEKIFMTKDGEVVRVNTVEQYPPDTQAAILWLSNRHPDKWKLRPEKDAGDDGGNVVINIVGGLPKRDR